MANAFKSGCVRGPYPESWNKETAYRIGRYLHRIVDTDKTVIGWDARLSSEEVFSYLSKGLTDSGIDVYSIGLVDTSALYFANMAYDFESSIMITASHNPPGDNGMKFHRKNVVPIDKKTGLAELEKLVQQDPGPPVERKGSVHTLDIRQAYLDAHKRFMKGIGSLKVAYDCSNGAASIFLNDMLRMVPGDYHVINDTPDGNFPNHGPDPLQPENLIQLKDLVLSTGSAMGICFDGDGDRAIFLDETGTMIMPDLMLAFLSRYYLVHYPELMGDDHAIIADLRSSSSVGEYVEQIGGTIVSTKTGHTAIQSGIQNNHGLIGAELSGHYYFRDYYGQDSAFIAMLMAMSIMSQEEKALSDIISDIKRHSFSGEINFSSNHPDELLSSLETHYRSTEGAIDKTEGVRVSFTNWWFLARASHTEPVLRLVVEAENDELMHDKIREIKEVITQ